MNDQVIDFEPLLALSKSSVSVGIPGGERAGLMYLHAHGSPARGIPPRPVLEPALEDRQVQGFVAECFLSAVLEAIEGGSGGEALFAAGALAEQAVKAYITSGSLTPNDPATVKQKGGSAPLIDSGALYAAITYRVEGGA